MKRIIIILFTILLTAFSAAAINIVHGPYLQNVKGTEATIVWISDSTSVGWVEIAPADGSHYYETERVKYFDSRYGIKTESRIHAVKISGLTPGTSYRYRVYAQEVTAHKGNYVAYGRIAATDVYRKKAPVFKTLDPEAESVSFAMVSDIHGDAARMRALLSQDAVSLEKTDMVLFVGDMVSVFESEEQVFGGFMDEAVKLFAAQTPMYYTRGNHETRGRSAYAFQDYFSPRAEHLYYMYRQGPVCFIALDCGEDKPDSDIEYYGITAYDSYRDEQAEWLKEVLSSEEFLSAPFRVVTCHMPPFGGWHGEKEVEQKFMPLLEAAGVDIMLCGHLHKYQHRAAGGTASFPIVVNANATVLKAEVSSSSMSVQVLDQSGKTVDSFTLPARR